MSPLDSLLLASIIPVSATIAGGALAAYRPPSASLTSLVQHAAAGAVFAAVSAELVFDLLEAGHVAPILIGFPLGTLLVLTLKRLADAAEARAKAGQSKGLIAATAIDVLIDGVVLGIGFAAGGSGGALLTIALTLELLFLGLTVASALGGPGRPSPRRVIAGTGALAILLPIGGVLGTVLGGLSGFAIDTTLAFAAAALLYLVTEELLVEAHEAEHEGSLTTLAFFGAFMLILVIDAAT